MYSHRPPPPAMRESVVDDLVGFLVRQDKQSRGVWRREGVATEGFLEEESQKGDRMVQEKTGRDRRLVQTRPRQITRQTCKQCLIQILHKLSGMAIQTRIRIPDPLLTCCATATKQHELPEPQFPHL